LVQKHWNGQLLLKLLSEVGWYTFLRHSDVVENCSMSHEFSVNLKVISFLPKCTHAKNGPLWRTV